ncbi:MAG: hypothetical protein ABSF64_25635 [Bryobacteraceae bacterium]|jgi:hypothetical protein
MTTVSSINSLSPDAYQPTLPSTNQPVYATSEAAPVDQVDITHAGDPMTRQASEAGRIALNAAAGNLTSDQATQLYQQLASIQTEIAADKQANGGTLSTQDAQSIYQLQSQLSGTIYSDAHNGATVPTTHPTESEAGRREELQAGRIELNVQAGNLSTSQAQQLTQQQSQIDGQVAADEQANGGSLTQAQAQQINQLQEQANKQIYQTVHGNSPDAQ